MRIDILLPLLTNSFDFLSHIKGISLLGRALGNSFLLYINLSIYPAIDLSDSVLYLYRESRWTEIRGLCGTVAAQPSGDIQLLLYSQRLDERTVGNNIF